MRRWHSDAKPTAICAKSRDRNFEGLTPTFSPPSGTQEMHRTPNYGAVQAAPAVLQRSFDAVL
jgi:hypothetical protein